MKQILVALRNGFIGAVIFLCCNAGFSQSFLTDSSSWNVTFGYYDFFTAPYSINGDSAINGKWYKRLVAGSSVQSLRGFLREDVKGKVYYIYPNDSNEILLYDFNLSVGDTFVSNAPCVGYKLIVTAVDTITLLDGQQKKRIRFGPGMTWIEGVGALTGLHDYTALYCYTHWITALLCCKRGDEVIFRHHDYDSCIYIAAGVENPELNMRPKMFPNPFSDRLNITLVSPSQVYLEIRSLSGQVMLTRQLEDETSSIDLGMLAAGGYVAWFYDDQNLLYYERLIKL